MLDMMLVLLFGRSRYGKELGYLIVPTPKKSAKPKRPIPRGRKSKTSVAKLKAHAKKRAKK